ncbi:hypothetical protein L7F22_056203 [Adiantum nelumboides]|nr:hypothetical protein [Adiantum nelumboides]
MLELRFTFLTELLGEDDEDYRKILSRSVALGIGIMIYHDLKGVYCVADELFSLYGLSCLLVYFDNFVKPVECLLPGPYEKLDWHRGSAHGCYATDSTAEWYARSCSNSQPDLGVKMEDPSTHNACAQNKGSHIESAPASLCMQQGLSGIILGHAANQMKDVVNTDIHISEAGPQDFLRDPSQIPGDNLQSSSLQKAPKSSNKVKPLRAKSWKMKVTKQGRKNQNVVTIGNAQRAAKKARSKLLGQGNAVTFEKVVELMLQNCPSLKNLGFHIDDVPSLQELVESELKVNNAILSHLAVRNVTTLYDLNQDILSTEGVATFNELRIGPLAFHPLIIEHFHPPKRLYRISSEEVMGYLSDYVGKDVARNIELQYFLSYIKKRRNFPSKNKLGVRFQNFGLLVSQIRCQKLGLCTIKSPVTRPREEKLEERLRSESHRFSETILEPNNDSEDIQFMKLSSREEFCTYHLNTHQMAIGNRLGEGIVFHHLVDRYGSKHVTWVNAETESGLPYDIIVNELQGQSLILVKLTWTKEDDCFEISDYEWEMATNKDRNFIIIRVFLSDVSGFVRLVWFPNPSKLCEEGKIKLSLAAPQYQPVGVDEKSGFYRCYEVQDGF